MTYQISMDAQSDEKLEAIREQFLHLAANTELQNIHYNIVCFF